MFRISDIPVMMLDDKCARDLLDIDDAYAFMAAYNAHRVARISAGSVFLIGEGTDPLGKIDRRRR